MLIGEAENKKQLSGEMRAERRQCAILVVQSVRDEKGRKEKKKLLQVCMEALTLISTRFRGQKTRVVAASRKKKCASPTEKGSAFRLATPGYLCISDDRRSTTLCHSIPK